jgi:galactose mutarotase-like enzyme
MNKVHTISGELLKFSVQDKGAELCSIISIKSGREFIWNANPEIWGSSAPVLFPIIGALKDNEFVVDGNKYSVPKHGFIRNNEKLTFKQISESCLEYSLKFDEESLKSYPFKFEFFVRYFLENNSIIVEHEIINHDFKNYLFFSLGGHPAFKCPVNEGEKYEDYFLEFEQNENVQTWEVMSSGLINSTTRPLLNNSNRINLTPNLFDNDALIIKEHISKKVSLKSKKSNQKIVVEYADFPYLGIWAKPGGHFVCIEPWLGISDSFITDKNFKTKEGILKLAPISNFKASYKIIIEE